MKFPRIGVVLDAQGAVVWGWTHPTATGEFEGFPPYVHNSRTGELKYILFSPDSTILDLEEHLDSHEMRELLRDRPHARWIKKSKGGWDLKQRVQHTDESGLVVEALVDHPIMVRRVIREKLKADLAQKKIQNADIAVATNRQES